MSDTVPQPGQVWAHRYQTANHVAVTDVHEGRARLIPVTVTPQGAVTPIAGRTRWSNSSQLQRAYRLTRHLLSDAI